jgi:protein ImuB
MVVWCPDWPVVAAARADLVAHDEPAAVFRANRVVAASKLARAQGVRRAMRRREAQSRCPELVVLDDDPGRDARLFEQVALAIDTFTPRIEVVRPGLCQFPTRGPSRYFGGDVALSDALRLALAAIGVEANIGVADGAFTAALAARAIHDAARHVAPTASAAYLADFPVTALVAVEGGRAVTRAAATSKRSRARSTSATTATTATDALALVDLVELLQRLGLSTLGSFAQLPLADVVARFGPVGERAWRLAWGLDAHPPQTRTPPPDLIIETELDPPVDRVDTAAFIAKTMAEELHARLERHGMACTRVSIEAVTADGVELARLWRHERAGAAGGLTAQNLADRVRWQIDGWLQQRAVADQKAMRADGIALRDVTDLPERLTGGLTVLRLVPDEVVPDEGRQLRLWGGSSAADERAARAFARVQGLLGPDSVRTPVLIGGRRPGDLVSLVPWGDERVVPPTAQQPWPGRLPSPLPTVVHPLPLAIDIVDATGTTVQATRRGDLSAPPASMVWPGSPGSPGSRGSRGSQSSTTCRIVDWAGPWPLEEKWWDVQSARRQTRMQIITSTKRAYLVVAEGGAWWVEGEYA